MTPLKTRQAYHETEGAKSMPSPITSATYSKGFQLTTEASNQKISYNSEIKRKLIHLSSLWIPLVIFVLPMNYTVTLFAVILIGLLIFELLRHQNHGLSRLVSRFFTPIMRPQELCNPYCLTGATYVLISALLCTLIFPTPVAVTALSIMLVADTAASLIGRRYGTTMIMGKSIEGSCAFLVTAIATSVIVGQIFQAQQSFYFSAIAASVAATAVELISSRLNLDDNLSVPLAAGGVMYFVASLF